MDALTLPEKLARLHSMPHKTAGGIDTPNTGHKAALHAVFLRLYKMHSAALLRLSSVMADCFGQLSGWPVPVSGSVNPIPSATQRLTPKGGGLSLQYRINQ